MSRKNDFKKWFENEGKFDAGPEDYAKVTWMAAAEKYNNGYVTLLESVNDELREQVENLYNIAVNTFKEPIPGLDPTFYLTLSYDSDMEIFNKIKRAKLHIKKEIKDELHKERV